MIHTLPRIDLLRVLFDSEDKIQRLHTALLPEQDVNSFMHIFTMSEAMERQRETNLPAKEAMKNMLPQEDVNKLIEAYHKNKFLNEEGMFTPFAQEFNFYCQLKSRN